MLDVFEPVSYASDLGDLVLGCRSTGAPERISFGVGTAGSSVPAAYDDACKDASNQEALEKRPQLKIFCRSGFPVDLNYNEEETGPSSAFWSTFLVRSCFPAMFEFG